MATVTSSHVFTCLATVKAYPDTAILQLVYKTSTILPTTTSKDGNTGEASIYLSIMDKYKTDKYEDQDLSRQTTTAEGQLEKKFSKLTMTGMAFAILK